MSAIKSELKVSDEVATEGKAKLVSPLTMENTAGAVVQAWDNGEGVNR